MQDVQGHDGTELPPPTKEHSRNIQGTFKEHSRNIQGTFKEHSVRCIPDARTAPRTSCIRPPARPHRSNKNKHVRVATVHTSVGSVHMSVGSVHMSVGSVHMSVGSVLPSFRTVFNQYWVSVRIQCTSSEEPT
eukprot:1181991-Prorocentrum_minimum.AAC.2